jgi:hypothetical protein
MREREREVIMKARQIEVFSHSKNYRVPRLLEKKHVNKSLFWLK